MVRHIELTIDFDLTCWAESMEDFENDDMEMINECVADYIIHDSTDLLDHLTIKKIWYEEEDEQSFFYLHENEHMFAHSRPVHTNICSCVPGSLVNKLTTNFSGPGRRASQSRQTFLNLVLFKELELSQNISIIIL